MNYKLLLNLFAVLLYSTFAQAYSGCDPEISVTSCGWNQDIIDLAPPNFASYIWRPVTTLSHADIDRVGVVVYNIATDSRINSADGTCPFPGHLTCVYSYLKACYSSKTSIWSDSCMKFTLNNLQFSMPSNILMNTLQKSLFSFRGNAVNQVISTVQLLIANPIVGGYANDFDGPWGDTFPYAGDFLKTLVVFAKHLLVNNLYDVRIIQWAYLEIISFKVVAGSLDKNSCDKTVFERFIFLNTFTLSKAKTLPDEKYTNETWFEEGTYPSKGKFVQMVNLAPDFEFSFMIYPTQKAGWENEIFRVTGSGRQCCGDGDLAFRVNVGNTYQEGLSKSPRDFMLIVHLTNHELIFPDLPLYVKTKVTIKIVGDELSGYFNDQLKVKTVSSSERYSGNAFFYASYGWSAMSNALVSEVSLKPIVPKFSKRMFVGTAYQFKLIENAESICNVYSMPDGASGCISLAIFLMLQVNPEDSKMVYDTLFKFNSKESFEPGSIQRIHQYCAKWHFSDSNCEEAISQYGRNDNILYAIGLAMKSLYNKIAPQQ